MLTAGLVMQLCGATTAAGGDARTRWSLWQPDHSVRHPLASPGLSLSWCVSLPLLMFSFLKGIKTGYLNFFKTHKDTVFKRSTPAYLEFHFWVWVTRAPVCLACPVCMFAVSSWDHTGAVIWKQLEVTRSGSSVLDSCLSGCKYPSTLKELALFMTIDGKNICG